MESKFGRDKRAYEFIINIAAANEVSLFIKLILKKWLVVCENQPEYYSTEQ
jgi:hypothetical protein